VGDAGLLSAEVHRRRYLITPPGLRRSNLAGDDLIIVDVGGDEVSGQSRLDPLRWLPHRLAYQIDPAADGSPVAATALALPPNTMALMMIHVGRDAELKLPGVPPLPMVGIDDEPNLRRALATRQAVGLPNLGVLTIGHDLSGVLGSLEWIEHAATVELARDHR